jgi:outer membrane receptor protein involved in Fe transport
MSFKIFISACIPALFFLNTAAAQETKSNIPPLEARGVRVSGTLVDSVSHESIFYGSVMLKNKTTEQAVGLNTDSLGRFTFEHIVAGDYHFSAFYVGYPKLERDVHVESKGADVDLGILYMSYGKNTLQEVKVVDFKDLIEQRPDGIVYNADRDGTNKGTTADQLLRKVPMLTVDLDGNVQMRGNGNIKVLIDGKPSTIIAPSVKDALKQIPSDNIKSVEVITSPGAKYDAEGAAGVINIITKKSIIKGMSGMLYSGLNYNIAQETLNGYAGVNVNYRNNKFGLSANLGGGRWTNQSDANSIRRGQSLTGGESVLQQSTFNDGHGTFLWGKISGDYDIDSFNSVSAGFGLRPGNWKSNIDQSTSFPDYGIDYTRHTDLETPRSNYSVDAAYNKKFKRNPKQTLDILSLYTIGKNATSYELAQTNNTSDVTDYREQSANDAKNGEFTLQADYTQPFASHNQKLETGLKYIDRNVSSDYSLYNWSPATGSEFRLDPFRTNLLKYNQQVAAAYGQFSTSLSKKISAVMGLRYEFTQINGVLRDHGGSFKNQFNNLMPSAILSWKIKNFNTLKLSYNQRIERPSIDFINPYINSSDSLNISQGNPGLEPELTHNIELAYGTIFKKSALNISAFYRITNNAIESYATVGTDGVNRSQFGNFARNNTLGLNLFGSTRLFNRWMINLNGNLYHLDLKSTSLQIHNEGWQYDMHLYSSFQIKQGFSVEGFVMYRDKQISLQGYQTGWFYYMLGLKKSVLKGKADISLVAENFLSPDIKVVSNFQYNNTDYDMTTHYRARGIRLSFSYRFGKMKFSGPENKVNNDDLKESDNKQQEGGGQMGGGGL